MYLPFLAAFAAGMIYGWYGMATIPLLEEGGWELKGTPKRMAVAILWPLCRLAQWMRKT